MLTVLDDYVAHIQSSGNKSLLARIYGVFTIKSNHFPDLDFLMMQNTVRLLNPNNDKLTFDIKGSKTKRWIYAKESNMKSKVLKDMNFLELDREQQLVHMSEEQRREVLAAFEMDSVFLRDHGIMDYSLLLVIESLNA